MTNATKRSTYIFVTSAGEVAHTQNFRDDAAARRAARNLDDCARIIACPISWQVWQGYRAEKMVTEGKGREV